jgi:hypothetical protein
MVAAIGGSTSSSGAAGQATTSRGSREGLEAKLDTFKKQLNDWVTCASAKTPEGKKKIADLTTKVSTTEARIKELDKTIPSRSAGASASSKVSDVGNARAEVVHAAAKTSSVETRPTGAGSGSVVDVFA